MTQVEMSETTGSGGPYRQLVSVQLRLLRVSADVAAASNTRAMVPRANEPDLVNMSMPSCVRPGCRICGRGSAPYTSQPVSCRLKLLVNPQNTAPRVAGGERGILSRRRCPACAPAREE